MNLLLAAVSLMLHLLLLEPGPVVLIYQYTTCNGEPYRVYDDLASGTIRWGPPFKVAESAESAANKKLFWCKNNSQNTFSPR